MLHFELRRYFGEDGARLAVEGPTVDEQVVDGQRAAVGTRQHLLPVDHQFHHALVGVAQIRLRAVTVHFPAANSETPNIRILVRVFRNYKI